MKALAVFVSMDPDDFYGRVFAPYRILSNGCCLWVTKLAHIVSFTPYG